MNPEFAAMRNIDRRRESHEELSLLMTRAHEKATRDVFSNPDYAIQEKEFSSRENPVYDPESVARDIAYVDRMRRKFDQKKRLVKK